MIKRYYRCSKCGEYKEQIGIGEIQWSHSDPKDNPPERFGLCKDCLDEFLASLEFTE